MPLIKGLGGRARRGCWGPTLTGAPFPASQLTKMVQGPFGLTPGCASTGPPVLYQLWPPTGQGGSCLSSCTGQLTADRLEEVAEKESITPFFWSLTGVCHMPWLLTWAHALQDLMASVGVLK